MLLAIAIVVGCAAAFDDLRRRAVSNWINLAALSAGLLYHGLQQGWTGLGIAASGALLGFLVFLVFYWLGAMGGGDVKLMAAFGALLGPAAILRAALLAALIGALLASACLVLNRRRRSIPYAPAIVLGAWLALLGGG